MQPSNILRARTVSADLIFSGGEFHRDWAMSIDAHGRIASVGPIGEIGSPHYFFEGRAIIPGFVNAHSHAFQRLLRGRTQIQSANASDNFWSWRQIMYQVAGSITPEQMKSAARQAFVEMALSGVTTVGEFHYVHHQPDGSPYDDPAIMAVMLGEAAIEVGIRLSVIRVCYLKGDFDSEPNQLQRRFCDLSVDDIWPHMEHVVAGLRALSDSRLAWGLAAHSIRAVPIESIVALKTIGSHLPMHIHVSEQPREVDGCIAKYGVPPVRLLAEAGVLDGYTTLVHATHLRHLEVGAIAASGAQVCVCPSTEADLGDGIGPIAELLGAGVPLSLGTDGQTRSSILSEACRLEMDQRLALQKRNVLVNSSNPSPARQAFKAATLGGAQSLDLPVGDLSAGRWADFCTIDLSDPHLAGADEASLLAAFVFSADSRAINDTVVAGRLIVEDRIHPIAETSGRSFARTCQDIFGQV